MLNTSKLTAAERFVLGDMIDEWLDKDRHGELKRERYYDDDDVDAVYALRGALRGA